VRFSTPLNPQTRDVAVERVRKAPDGWVMELSDQRRTSEQNRKLWPALTDISIQVDWHGTRLSPEDWKTVFLAALSQEMRLVPNLDNTGLVSLRRSSSGLSKNEFSDLLELIMAFGAQRGVKWS
jgi:hypothetical protein